MTAIESVAVEVVPTARLVVAYAETVGLVEVSREAGVTVADFNRVLRALAAAGVVRRVEPLRVPAPAAAFLRAVEIALDAIEVSPLPSLEWAAMCGVLDSLLPELVGVSTSSVTRYRTGERSTPDAVAARLHTVTLIASDLSGSYNDFGVRRWFLRPRQALGGKAPAQVLVGDWGPDDPAVMEVRALAASLVGLGAA